jgi:nicotinate-nucleotide pyrophosphorylase (carboxylating)
VDRLDLVKKCFNSEESLSLENPYYRSFTADLFNFLLNSDLRNSDISQYPHNIYEGNYNAEIIAKSYGIAACLDEIIFLLKLKGIEAKTPFQNGVEIQPHKTFLSLSGKVADILSVERTILNFIQRLTGIATLTKKYVDTIGKRDCFVAGTRKTLWGYLDKKAVQCGGGISHRLNLNDAAILKDNHLTIIRKSLPEKGLQIAISEIAKNNNSLKFVEVEVKNEGEFEEVVEIFTSLEDDFPKAIMFDHLTPKSINKMINKVKSNNQYERIFFEASGDISLNNISEYAKSGVDLVSVGALTHSAKSCDFTLLFH